MKDAFRGVPWPGWNRALHRIVTSGPGWNPALEWAMSSGEQPILSFVEGLSGVRGLRAQSGSSTEPASWRNARASRVRQEPFVVVAAHGVRRRAAAV